MYTTPILFLVFNRPETTRSTFELIRRMQPEHLYIAADGPRENVEGESNRCMLVRELISNGIDWPCHVKYLYRSNNLGCGRAVREAITWFFSQVEYGIILEDDCLPNTSFFKFCSEMLDLYKDNERVFHITGSNFQSGKKIGYGDYYFSEFIHVWGWASWRRAWDHYDSEMAGYYDMRNTHPQRKLLPWSQFDEVYNGSIDTWDMQWFFTCLKHNALSIVPNYSLIKNVGFTDAWATHTNFKEPEYIRKAIQMELNFPLKHPRRVQSNKTADKYTALKVFGTIKYSPLKITISKVKKWLVG